MKRQYSKGLSWIVPASMLCLLAVSSPPALAEDVSSWSDEEAAHLSARPDDDRVSLHEITLWARVYWSAQVIVAPERLGGISPMYGYKLADLCRRATAGESVCEEEVQENLNKAVNPILGWRFGRVEPKVEGDEEGGKIAIPIIVDFDRLPEEIPPELECLKDDTCGDDLVVSSNRIRGLDENSRYWIHLSDWPKHAVHGLNSGASLSR